MLAYSRLTMPRLKVLKLGVLPYPNSKSDRMGQTAPTWAFPTSPKKQGSLRVIHSPPPLLHLLQWPGSQAGRVNQALVAIHELKQHFKQSIHSETDEEYVGMAVARKSKEAEVQTRRFKVFLLEARIHDLQVVVMHISPA
ncbi:hypothetical protein GOP47_0007385 [Adiantum capillus-veneris]|uniref:Uncharacterized protein n=1 Tax=Adiantum capillus-veneris TaxID=13818 RepID=A0A9D4ZLH0_ADICA|nr:hypothetical protein GOP47_0007385 [Adiantum capillus-veneris]